MFKQALELESTQRVTLLDQARIRDPGLVAEVEELLAPHAQRAEFLKVSLPDLLGGNTSHTPSLVPGSLLKQRYRVEYIIDQGGFATVYRAKDELVSGKAVVIKVLDRMPDGQINRESFLKEIESLSRIQHPNVIGISDAGVVENGTPFLVLAYVKGQNLRRVLASGPLPLTRTLTIIRNVSAALNAAHKAGVWHLDIKPENIILTDAGTEDERVTVIDFGIARVKSLSSNGILGGSPHYLAPEQPTLAVAQSDVYSLALVAFELLTGRLPQTNRRIFVQLPPMKAGPRFANAIARALSFDPGQRQPSPKEFARSLGAIQPYRAYFAAVAAVAVLGLALILTYVGRGQLSEAQYSTPVPFATMATFEQRPAFSPDGKVLYYVSGPPENTDIYSRTSVSASPIRLVGDPNNDDFVQCSPDGRSLAFIRNHKTRSALIVKQLDGGGETELAQGESLSVLSWAADGKALIVAQADENKNTRTLKVITISSRQWHDFLPVEPKSLGYDHPSVSPDGKHVAFIREWAQDPPDLVVVDVNSRLEPYGKPRPIIRNGQRMYSLQWTPDSRDIVYVAGPLGNGSIWRVRAAGGIPNPVLPGAGKVERIAIPRRSWSLAYAVQYTDANVWRYNISAGTAAQIINSSYDDEEPRRSPNGKSIVLSSSRTGSEQAWLEFEDGNEPRQLTNFAAADAVLGLWTPDSNRLFISVRSRELGLRTYSAEATSPFRLTELLKNAFASCISRDGRWIYFRSLRDGQWELFRTESVAASHEIRITSGGGYFGIESTDGRSLYFTKRQETDGLWVQSLPNGLAHLVVQSLHRRNLFAPSKNGVYYIGEQPSSQEQSLYFWDARKKDVTLLHTFDRPIFWGLDLSPDERQLLFSQEDVGNIDIMLVERFR